MSRREEASRGQSVGYDEAYSEGYAAKYNGWSNRENPYQQFTAEYDGYEDGYCEAVIFAC